MHMNSKATTLLLGFTLSICSCNAASLHTGQGTTKSEMFELLEKVYGDLSMMRRVESRSFCKGSVSECMRNIEFPFGQKTLCYVYDRYKDYSQHLLSTSPDSPLFVTYTANQYVAWKALSSTCEWVNLNTNNTLRACTVPEIGEVCVIYRIYESFLEIKTAFTRHVQSAMMDEGEIPIIYSESDWLQSNLTPEPGSISSTLLSVTGCTKNKEGKFSC